MLNLAFFVGRTTEVAGVVFPFLSGKTEPHPVYFNLFDPARSPVPTRR
jgi:hypothetical protein